MFHNKSLYSLVNLWDGNKISARRWFSSARNDACSHATVSAVWYTSNWLPRDFFVSVIIWWGQVHGSMLCTVKGAMSQVYLFSTAFADSMNSFSHFILKTLVSILSTCNLTFVYSNTLVAYFKKICISIWYLRLYLLLERAFFCSELEIRTCIDTSVMSYHEGSRRFRNTILRSRI